MANSVILCDHRDFSIRVVVCQGLAQGISVQYKQYGAVDAVLDSFY